MLALTYLLPLKASELPTPEFVDYVNQLSTAVEMILIDGSSPDIYRAIDEHCAATVRHLPPDEEFNSLANGKVRGVLTGLRVASHDWVVVADDDVRYTLPALHEIREGLAGADVVLPQNYFDPLPWHARLDTARMLINRVTGGDWPGTLGLRRSVLGPAGDYDGNVLFENLELVRTVRAAGGTEARRSDLFVARRPPTTAHFWSQRTRQAYDEFARPYRLAAALAIVPVLGGLLFGRRWTGVAMFMCLPIVAAEAGRRRGGGRRVFPASSAWWAPVWVVERGIGAWLAVGARLFLGGVPYAGRVLKTAANSERTIARQRQWSR